MENTVEERPVLTVDETAELLGISRYLAYKAVREGELPVIRLGYRLLVPRVALDRLLAQHAQEAEKAGSKS